MKSPSRQRRVAFQPLEPRMMLHGDPSEGPHDHLPGYDLDAFHVHAQLTISINGQIVPIPDDLGIDATGFLSFIHTHDPDNVLHLHNINGQSPDDFLTLGDFFETWRTNAGFPGNNPNAVLSSTQILGHVVDDENPLRMFVNGVETTEFEDYAIRPADNIVLVYGSNPLLTLETNQGRILIELLPDVAPITVNNFLNYVNGGDYDNSFFHRLVPGFVLQGGGFTSQSGQFPGAATFSPEPVPTDPPILNEFQRSNLRGTIAMAKTALGPNTATSQWFVNLANNSSNLDNQNGGFTVFGQVLGMWTGRQDVTRSTVDIVAGFSTVDAEDPAGVFGDLPVDSQNNLVRIESIEGEGLVRGSVFVDANSNQVFDSGETPIEDVVVFADANQNGVLDSGETTTRTNAGGDYLLRLPAGSHVIRQIVEDPFIQTNPLNPNFHTVTVGIGRDEIDVDFANVIAGINDDSFIVPEDSEDFVLDVRDNDTIGGSSEGLIISDVSNPDQGGVVSVSANQLSLIYTPRRDFVGTETFTYDVTNGMETLTATVVVTVTDVNDPPTAVDDEFAVVEDTPTNLFVLANDLQAPDSGETLRVQSIVIQPNAGTARIGDNGNFIRYTPPPNFVGTHTFTYTISDRSTNGLTSQATVTVFIDEANDNPTANEDSFVVDEDSQEQELDVLLNDSSEPDVGETLTIASVDPQSFSQGGSAILSPDSLLVLYTPAPNFNGTETFRYTISDGRGGSAQATATVFVRSINDPPTAADDLFVFTRDTGPHVLDVLANDSILPDTGETLTIINPSVSVAAGTVQVIQNGQRIEYTPAVGFTGDAIISYTIDDGNGGTDVATATVTIRDFLFGSLSGFVYFDSDNDGVFDSNESPIGGVTITLAGTDSFGEQVNRTTTSAANGSYSFGELAPGSYTITQIQPTTLLDGIDTIGTQGGNSAQDSFTIELAEGVIGTGNNFGERGRSAQLVGLMDFFAIRAQPLVLSANTASGQAWYSVASGWNDFGLVVVDVSDDLGEVEVSVIDNGNMQHSRTAATDGNSARIIRRAGSTTLVGLLVDSQTFGFTPSSQGSNAMAVAIADMGHAGPAHEHQSSSESEMDSLAAAIAAAIMSGEFGEDAADLAAKDAVFEELGLMTAA